MSLDTDQIMALGEPISRGRVKQRQGAKGSRLSYIETWDAKRTANEIFGYGNWGYELAELFDLGVEKHTNKEGREGHRIAYRCRLRLEVFGCLPIEDVGYGEDISYTSILQSHELASKEAVSDALKRALVAFGDQFGLSLYDKEAPEHKAAASSQSPPPARRRSASKKKTTGWADKTDAQRDLLNAAKDAKIDAELRHRICRMLTGYESSNDMTDAECKRVTKQLAWFQTHRGEGMVALQAWELKAGLL